MCENSRYLGTLVRWNNFIWYVDNDNCNFKDENDETSLFFSSRRICRCGQERRTDA